MSKPDSIASTTAKLQKLSKADLIWLILEYEKHTLGYPSLDVLLSDLQYKKEKDNINRCEQLAAKAQANRDEYIYLISPYVGKPILDIPKNVLDRAMKLLKEADAADKEWYRLGGIKVE